MGSTALLLAGANPDNPFRFTAVEMLRGASPPEDLPHLIDSATRKRFAKSPGATVLFSQDSETKEWQRLAIVDDEVNLILREILARMPDWRAGNEEDRAKFFASLLDHPNTQIHNLALGELDRLDYGVFRSLALKIDTHRIAGRINVVSETNLKPIRVLLLGMSDDQGLQEFFQNGVRFNARSEGPMLGAYAIALLEYGGAEAIQWLVHTQLTRAALPQSARTVLVGAMATQERVASADMSETIRRGLGKSVILDVELARIVNSQFGLGVAPNVSERAITLEVFSKLTATTKN